MIFTAGTDQSFCICVTCHASEQETTNTDQSEDSLRISIQCHLPIGYPYVLPSISLSCNSLTKHSTNQLRDRLYEYAESLKGQPMIMDLVYWLKQNVWRLRRKTEIEQNRYAVNHEKEGKSKLILC